METGYKRTSMATEALWQKLLNLITIDKKQEKFSSQITLLENTVQEIKGLIPDLQTSIESLKQFATNAKKQVDAHELNAQDLKNKLDKKNKALDFVKNQKEYIAIEKEIKSISSQMEEMDDALVEAWNTLETTKKEQESKIPTITIQIEAQQKLISEKEAKILQIKQERSNLDLQRKEAVSALTPEWLTKYDRMKGRVIDPIVPVLNNSCSGCYYLVPTQDLARLKREAVLPCRSCYRLLYFDQNTQKESVDASF